MNDDEAHAVLKKWSDITNEASFSGCAGVGMFFEDMFELRMAYNRVSMIYEGVPSDSKIREYNGMKIILQELVDMPRTGRI